MSDRPRQRSGGLGWVVLIALPPVIVVVGLAAFFAWQIRKGTVTPKWKAKPVATNQVPASGAQR